MKLKKIKVIQELVIQEIKGTLGLDESKNIDLDLGFFDMGMDSIMSVDLGNRLSHYIGPCG